MTGVILEAFRGLHEARFMAKTMGGSSPTSMYFAKIFIKALPNQGCLALKTRLNLGLS